MIRYRDFNFKLSIISCLNELGVHFDEAEKIRAKAMSTVGFRELAYDAILFEVSDYYERLSLEDHDLARIKVYAPTASSSCYNLLVKEWSGEDDIFNIQSLNGIEYLINLEVFKPFGLLDYNVDIKALCLCKKLKVIYSEFIPVTRVNDNVLNSLSIKGIEIKN